MPVRAYRWIVVLVTLLAAGVYLLWGLLTPGFRAPDEPQHYNSVMRVATGGGWPEAGTAIVSAATVTAAEEAGFVPDGTGISMFDATVLPRGTLQSFGGAFVEVPPLPRSERSVVDHTAGPERDAPTVDQMTQHPPLYYYLAAGVVHAFGALDWRWDQQLLLLRSFSALLAAGAVPLVAETARRLTDSPWVGVVAATATLAVPQLGFVAGSVTNDVAAVLLGSAVLMQVVRTLRGAGSVAHISATGLVLGLAILTKAFVLVTVPVVAVAFLLGGPKPWTRRALRAFGALAVAFVVGGWWWARNLLLYGTIQPPGMGPPGFAWGDRTPTVGEYLPEAAARLTRTFWGHFGWLEAPLPSGLVAALTLTGLALVLTGILTARRGRGGLILLLSVPGLITVAVLAQGWASYLDNGLFGGLQGRYLFTGIAALAAGAAMGLAGIARAGPVLARVVPPVLALAATGLAAAALVFAFRTYYQVVGEPTREAFARWADWSSTGPAALWMVLVLAGLLGVAVAVATAVLPLPRPHPGDVRAYNAT